MTEQSHHGFGKKIIFAAILVGVIANTVSITLPVFLTALARSRGLSETQSGLFAMAELGGVAIGSIACVLFVGAVKRLNWRGTAMLGLCVLIVANLLMALPMNFALLFIFASFAGVGAGLVNAVLYAVLAECDGASSVAAFYATQLGFGAVAVPLLSAIADHLGGEGLFLTLAVLGVVAFLPTRLFPPHGLAERHGGSGPIQSEKISSLGWTAILGLFVFFVGSGAVFSFLAYMGIGWGGDSARVEDAVSIIMLLAMFGALLVAAIGSRFGYVWPMSLGVGGTLVAIGLFIVATPVAFFLSLGALFYVSANIAAPYMFDALTDVDRSSSAAMMTGAAQLGGVAIGPAIAGYLVTSDYRWVNGFALGFCALALCLFLCAIWLHRRRESPSVPHISRAC
nr:MFS transporter [Sphingomonas sp. CDS-1]